jgi:hypothetical protein
VSLLAPVSVPLLLLFLFLLLTRQPATERGCVVSGQRCWCVGWVMFAWLEALPLPSDGGVVDIVGGASGGAGSGGAVHVTGGSSASGTGGGLAPSGVEGDAGGDVVLSAGDSVQGGNVVVTAGAGSSQAGGNLRTTSGQSTSVGESGGSFAISSGAVLDSVARCL